MKAKWINMMALVVSPVAIATVVVASVNFNQNQIDQNQDFPQNPEFDLTWVPTQPTTVVIPADLTNQPFQNVVETMVANQQLTIGWQFDLVSPYQLLKQFQNNYQELTKAFSFNYFDPDSKQWTSDHNWKFAITNVDLLNQNQIELSFEIYQYDQNHFATGQIATIKKSFSLQNQLPDPASYYQAVLKQIKLVRKHDVSNISFATLLQNLHFGSDFQAWWMLPPIIGANLKLSLGSQLIEDQIVYDLIINDQYRLNHQIYQIPDQVKYHIGILNDFDLANLATTTQGWIALRYLTIINNRNQQLVLDQDFSAINNIQTLDLQGFANIKIQPNFIIPFVNTLKFAKQMQQLIVPQQPNFNNFYRNVILPEQKDLKLLNQWYTYFNLDKRNLLTNHFHYEELKTLFFANFPIYDQASQTLNLEVLQQWAKATKQSDRNIGNAIIKSITQTFKVKSLVLPINYQIITNPDWNDEWSYDLQYLPIKFDEIETIKFGSQTYQQPVYELFREQDLEAFTKILPNPLALKTIAIPPSVVVFSHANFQNHTNVAKLIRAGIKISRQIDPQIRALIKDRFNLEQKIPVKLINDPQSRSLSTYGGNNLFNQFDLLSNQNLANQVQTIIKTINQVDPNGERQFLNLIINDLGWMLDRPSWLAITGQNNDWVFDWISPSENYQYQSQYLTIPKLSSPKQLIINASKQNDRNLIYQAVSGFDPKMIQNKWREAISSYRFNLINLNLKFNEQTQQPPFINNGVLDLKQYLAQFKPLQADTSLINYQDQIKTIKVDPQIKTIPAAAFAGIRFKNQIVIDLTNVSTIGDAAFFNTNLIIKNLNFTTLTRLGILALANLTTGFDQVDFTNNQALKIIPAAAFANTKVNQLKLSSQIDTIGAAAFQSSQLSFNIDQPLDLKTIKNLAINSFSNNPNLKKVINYQLDSLVPAFDRTGIVSFDFSKIKTITTNFNTFSSNRQQQWLFSQTWSDFQDQTLDLSNWIPDQNIRLYRWNLPSVKTVILNPILGIFDRYFEIQGLQNLTKIINWNSFKHPRLIFSDLPQLEIENSQPVLASAIGYDQNQQLLDWTFLNPWIEQAVQYDHDTIFSKKVIEVYYQSELFFQQNPQATINKLIIPSKWFDFKHLLTNLQIFWGLDLIHLPPIKTLAISDQPMQLATGPFETLSGMKIINQFFQNQTFSQLDQAFFKNFYYIPGWIFTNINFTNPQVINLFNPINIATNAFWNSSLNHFIGLDQPKAASASYSNYGRIANNAFNPDTTIKIGKTYRWIPNSFGLQFDQFPPNVQGFDQPISDITLGGFYDPIKRVLDFRQLALIENERQLADWLDLIKFQLKTTSIKALYLPKWNWISNQWLAGWTHVEFLFIDPSTTWFGGKSSQYPSPDPNRHCFKNIPKLIHTNIIKDESGFWNEIN